MTRTDAVAYAEDGIRVNAVLPGFTRTPSECSAMDGFCFDDLT